MGLPLSKPPKVTPKVELLLRWFNEIEGDRSYQSLSEVIIPRRLTPALIAPYYELMELEGVITKNGFIKAMREVDSCWFTADAQHKAKVKVKKPVPS